MIVFLCQHGGAKSVIAATYFSRLAEEADLQVPAIALAAEDPYDAVPQPVAEVLEKDGFAVRSFIPRAAARTDLEGAARIISIGCDLTSYEGIERWDDVPMASEDLPGSIAAIRSHVERLIEELKAPEPWPSFLSAMARIAVHSFGGPVAQIGIVHEEVVERRKWIDEETFGRLLSFANVLPGPEALELVIHVGYVRRGLAGGIVGGLFFIFPGVVSLTVLAWLYAQYGATEIVSTIQGAIRPVAVALVVAAALRLSRRLLTTVPAFAIAAAAMLASHFLGAPFVVVLVSGGLAGLLIRVPPAASRPSPTAGWKPAVLVVIALTIGLATPRVEPAAEISTATQPGSATLPDIALLNLKTALVTFGGAYTALPYIRDQVVHRFGWLPDGAVLDALALGETTPGPLISIGVFVSYLAGGLPGALVGALFLFLPSFVLVLSLGRYVERITALPGIRRLLEGIMAATVGLILALTIDVAGGINGVAPALIGAGAFAAVTFARVSPAWVVLVVIAGALGLRR